MTSSKEPESVPVVILAGGRGARFDHESQVKPKPLIEVTGKPILGHIMDLFEAQGFDDFIILGGYLCDQVKDYVSTRYECRATPPGYDHITVFGDKGAKVKTHVFDTGVEMTTGGRLYSLTLDFMPRESRFFLTYGDGLADVDLKALLAFHDARRMANDPRVTLTAVHPPGRFGILSIVGDRVTDFREKSDEDLINGGFMVVDRGVVPLYVPDPDDAFQEVEEMPSFESGALPVMARKGLLSAFRHDGYWRCMDTRRDLEQIEEDVRKAGALPWRRDMMAK